MHGTSTRSPKQKLRQLYHALRNGRDLKELAMAFGTDKEGDHHYAERYQFHFAARRRERLNILEIGIGGYANPRAGGESLRMWKTFFPHANVFGIDIHDKTFHDEARIRTFRGNQTDPRFLTEVMRTIGPVDIIIDDGSHKNADVVASFTFLFPLLNSNGIYVVEDLQTSYWDSVEGKQWGGSEDVSASHTSMAFFKSLLDGLNFEEFVRDDYAPSYFDKHIVAVHFYHNLVFVCKGLNNEGSNVLGRRFS